MIDFPQIRTTLPSGHFVSTVQLISPEIAGQLKLTILDYNYETMVFLGNGENRTDVYTARYESHEQAHTGHWYVVTMLTCNPKSY